MTRVHTMGFEHSVLFLTLGYIAGAFSCIALWSLYRGFLLKRTQHRQEGSTCYDQSSMLLHNHVSRDDFRRQSRCTSTTKSPWQDRRPQPGRRNSVEAASPRLDLISDDMVQIEGLTRLEMTHFDKLRKLDPGRSAAAQPTTRLHRPSSENDLYMHGRIKSISRNMQDVKALQAAASTRQTPANTKRSPKSDHVKAGRNCSLDLRRTLSRGFEQNALISVSSSSRFYAEVVTRAKRESRLVKSL
jgi:hypothetical protein